MPTALFALVASLLLACCQAPAPDQTITGIVTAGPVCPVVTDPPDPDCEDRPVAGGEIVVRNAAGDDGRSRPKRPTTAPSRYRRGGRAATSWFRSPSKA